MTRISECFDHNRTKKKVFLGTLQKYYQLPILDNSDMYGHKNDRSYDFSACKKWTPSLTSFLRYCKGIANLLLWELWEYLIMPINNDSITLYRKLWCSKCWNQLVRNFDVYLHAKNQLHLLLLFWGTVRKLQTCYFVSFGNAWPPPSK